MAQIPPRVQRELTEIARDNAANISVTLLPGSDKINALQGTITGPPGTPYDGGTFVLDIKLPDSYPFEPPKVRFVTKVWHPNVSSQTGAICLDVLKDQWSPALTLKTVLLSVQALLSSPEPRDPQDAVVAQQYLTNPDAFAQTAREWTAQHAKKDAGPSEKVLRLMEMGFVQAAVQAALIRSGDDENAALEALLSG